MKFKGLIFTLFLLYSYLNAKDIIWDFGGIIFHPDKFGVGREVGLSYFLKYMVLDMKSPDIQNDLFKFLDTVMPNDKKFGAVGTGDGATLPTIMRHWQAGTISGPDIIKITIEHIKKMDKIGYFRSNYEKKLYQRVVSAMFNPKILANNIYPVEQGIKLLKKCAAAKNPDGSKKNNNYGGSNMDLLTFVLSKKLYPEIFDLFDGIVISGDIGQVKPDAGFYTYILNKFNLNPQNVLLIDDQEVNVKGARNCRIPTLLLNNWDYNRLEQELIAYGAIPSR